MVDAGYDYNYDADAVDHDHGYGMAMADRLTNMFVGISYVFLSLTAVQHDGMVVGSYTWTSS